MDIYFSADNRKEVIKIPVLPNIDIIDWPTDDEEFKTVNGTLLLIGNKGLRSFSLTSFFPSKSYTFAKFEKPPEFYIKFFEKWRDKKVPIRVIIINKGREMLNMACRVNFSHGIIDKAGDTPYSLEIKEYVFAKAKRFGNVNGKKR